MLVSLGVPGTCGGLEVGPALALALPATTVLSPLREKGLLGNF